MCVQEQWSSGSLENNKSTLEKRWLWLRRGCFWLDISFKILKSLSPQHQGRCSLQLCRDLQGCLERRLLTMFFTWPEWDGQFLQILCKTCHM